ncbi:MAG: class I SAM-dependent methyltransferase, partial [Nitrososphaeria archaeon]|nr:class I SAM-dependent methyltransferase [Nitrososphaeria archaeon]NIQ34123.1 class I SAM-dependent methyltransferase [Nitrososphaeria archaeon]
MSLRHMFASVVKKYDLLNHLLTWGLDEVWRKTCSKEC